MDFDLENIILRIPAILLALTIHEYAHGWVAYRLGDRTAYDAGRLTLNPIAHLDPIGTLLLLRFNFGWAKPVPVNPHLFINPKKGILYVSAAGPLSNILLALIFGFTFRFIIEFHFIPPYPYLIEFLRLGLAINIGIAFFNLLPIPPLDGSKIVLGFLPDAWVPGYLQKTRYFPIFFIGLILIDTIMQTDYFSRFFTPFFDPFGKLIYFLIFWRIT